MDCVDHSRLLADVEWIAKPRPPGSSHWRAVQLHCERTLRRYGFEVELHRDATGVNVIGVRSGGSQSHEQVVVGAHYDHLPGCPGADDNASGVAGALELARTLGPVDFQRTLGGVPEVGAICRYPPPTVPLLPFLEVAPLHLRNVA